MDKYLQEIVNQLNSMLEADREAISHLMLDKSRRVRCNENLANHPTCQVGLAKNIWFEKLKNFVLRKGPGKVYDLGPFGVLAGIAGSHGNGWAKIVMQVDTDKGLIENFEILTEEKVGIIMKKWKKESGD
jgi:hypothetical protein